MGRGTRDGLGNAADGAGPVLSMCAVEVWGCIGAVGRPGGDMVAGCDGVLEEYVERCAALFAELPDKNEGSSWPCP